MKKNIIIIITIFILFLLSSCGNENIEIIKKHYSTGSVFSGSIDTSNSFVWYVEWEQMVDLATKVGWKITNMYVKQWDFVKKWDLLANLDSSEAKVWYSSAENIINSLLIVKKSTSEMFDKQIISMNSKIEQVKLWEKWMKNWLEDIITITDAQLKTANTWVETARVNLEHTKIILDTKENHIYDNWKEAIVWAIILDVNVINFVDELLWITDDNKYDNDEFEDYLSAKNPSYLSNARVKFRDVNITYKEFKSFYDNEIDWKTPSKEIVLKWLIDWEKLTEKLKSLLSLTYDVIDNSIESINFNKSTINNYKTQISIFANNIESSLLTVSWEYILWLKWSKQWLIDFDKAKAMQIDLLEKQLLLAEDTLAQYKAISKWQVREVETKKEVSSNQLNEVFAWLESLKKQKETSLNEIQAKINEAIGQRNSAWVMINNWKIVSPIDWIITFKSWEVWQVVWWWMPILSISNEDNLELNISVSEEISNNIKLGDTVSLDIEWVDDELNWDITNIFKSKDLITKKVWVEISFNNIWKKIKVWSYTKVIFKNTWNNDSIIISNAAIISKFMVPWVYVLEENIVKFKNIEILKQNDSFSEIQWLNVWEIIIINWKENIWDGEILE